MVALIVKIMPESPDSNLEEIESQAKEVMEKEGARNYSFEERPIAFGLKAVMMKMALCCVWRVKHPVRLVNLALCRWIMRALCF